MTQYLDIDNGASFLGGLGEVTVNTGRSGADDFRLITTAWTMMENFGEDKGGISKDDEVDEGKVLQLEEAECMHQSTRLIIKERRFFEFVPGNALIDLGWDNGKDDDVKVEGAVMV
jgi:hypothetical protein